VNRPGGPAYNAVISMMANENTFYSNYQRSWKIATENGSGLTNQYQAAALAAIAADKLDTFAKSLTYASALSILYFAN
jgi:hypothetical protein